MTEKDKLVEQLKEFLCGARKIAIVGVGNEWRQDDAVGVAVVEQLYKRLSGSEALPLSLSKKEFKLGRNYLKIFKGADTPERLTGQLRKFKTTHVIFIDAAELAKSPGEIELVPLSEVKGDEISTHNIPLSILGKFLELDMGCRTVLLGIQPGNIQLSMKKNLTPELERAAEIAANIIQKSLELP